MIALRLVRLIEAHSDQLAKDLMEKLQASSRTSDLRKVPEAELSGRILEILQHLSEWLLTKTDSDIQSRYRELGARRAAQGVSIADFCSAVMLTKEHLWEFLQRQGFLRGPVEIYGEMELLWLLNQFFDRALCYALEGYERQPGFETKAAVPDAWSRREVNAASWVP
jgi:RsbT co-antagonist protein rsbRD N-terminal domain